MRFIDWFYTEEGTMTNFWGPEGIAWEKAAPGQVGVNGQPAVWKQLSMKEGDEYFGNLTWGGTFPFVMPGEMLGSIVAPDSWFALDDNGSPTGLEKYLYEQTRDNYAPYGEPVENILPPLFVQPDDIDELAQLKASLYPYVDEALARFIVGDLDIEADWDRHLRELESLGLSRYLEIMQKAYDASAFAK